MNKYIYGALALLLLASCGQAVEETTPVIVEEAITVETVSVTSSIIPLSSVISAVGGEYVEVNNIIPAGVSPHGFDMSAQDMIALQDSQMVFMTGLEHIDGFLEKAATGKKQVHIADGMELLEASAHDHHDEHDEHKDDHHDEDEHHEDTHEDEEHHDEDEHDEHEEENHNKDPHVWLGKDNIITIANTVRDELSSILPEQADYFAANTLSFSAEIENAYAEFEKNTAGKTPEEFIVFHDAYNYLFESIGLDENLKIPFSQNILHESGTAHFAELIDEIELHNIRYIFREPQFSDTSLQKFTGQYNLSVGTLDPLGTNPGADGYLENLKNNLSALQNIYE